MYFPSFHKQLTKSVINIKKCVINKYLKSDKDKRDTIHHPTQNQRCLGLWEKLLAFIDFLGRCFDSRISACRRLNFRNDFSRMGGGKYFLKIYYFHTFARFFAFFEIMLHKKEHFSSFNGAWGAHLIFFL